MIHAEVANIMFTFRQQACEAASKKLTDLRELEIWVYLPHVNGNLSLREKWIAPLLHFRRLAFPREATSPTVVPRPFGQRQPGLQIAKVCFQRSYVDRWCHNHDRGLVSARRELYLLFGQAIGLAITGATEEAAMSGFREAYEGRHAQYRPYFPPSWTGR